MSVLLQLVLLVGAVWGLAYYRVAPKAWTVTIGIVLFALTVWGSLPGLVLLLSWALFIPAALFANHAILRRDWVTRGLFSWFKKALPPMSKTEQEALEAGDTWWEAELFKGSPDWQQLHKMPKPQLTAEEQSFLDNQVSTLCAMLDDWQITHNDKDLPKAVWDYLKKERFFGMIIPKEYGGLEFTALMHSEVITKIATRGCSAAVTTMVPNSLGPAELLLHYGTDEQKQRYLPGLAKGEEIPCFALTAPTAGSDAGSIPDTGVVCEAEFEGKKTLGIRLNFDKRYITLAPVATVLGLAFKMYDPDHLMGDKTDHGITVALIPTNTPGIDIGQRHNPLSMAFHNGPVRGKDVFIPLDWIIGGPKMAGKGWRMLVECLSAGRAISLPALGTATASVCYRTTGAYAAIRKQFKMPIGKFEGIQEAMARIGGYMYMMEASRVMTAHSVDQNIKPAVVSAIAKYHMTETARKIIIDAMDVHAGKGIILGPRNYLGRAYQAMPISITVEGANILTRNLIIFGQGAIRCHPYVLQEMQATSDEDQTRGFETFDEVLLSHVGYGVSNFARTLWMGITHSITASAPTNGPTAKYYKHLSRMSATLALVADIAMLMLGGELKRKESLSARLGDVLSHLYLSSAVLKYYEEQGRQHADLIFVQWVLENALYQMQAAFNQFYDNFPNKTVGRILRWTTFPLGMQYKQPSDSLSAKIADEMMADSELRNRITHSCFISNAEDDPIGRVERAFILSLEVAPIEKKVKQAIKQGTLQYTDKRDELITNAIEGKVITSSEAEQLRDCDIACLDAIQVDDFDPNEYRGVSQECKVQPKTQVA